MSGIFLFSAQNGLDSSQTSSQATLFFHQLFPYLSYDQCTLIIRKIAHFSIYAALGFCFCPLFFPNRTHQPIHGGKIMLYSWAASFLYALSDELHQTFVPGRIGSFTDCLLDGAGAAFGITLFFLFIHLAAKKIQEKK